MSDQLEFQCPQCRKRTLVPPPANNQEEETIFCVKCEVAMVKKAAVSQVAEASANAPARSSNQATAVASAPTARKTKTKSASKTGVTKTRATTARTRASAVATPAVVVAVPEFGNFRCPCCGMAKTIAPGEGKAGVPARCQTCFVKLDFLK